MANATVGRPAASASAHRLTRQASGKIGPVARVERRGQEVTVRLSALEKLGALQRDVTFPRSAVVDVRPVARADREVKGMRSPGTALPGVRLGTWRAGRHAKDFAAVYGRGPGVVIELQGASFARVVLSTSEPEAVRRLLLGT